MWFNSDLSDEAIDDELPAAIEPPLAPLEIPILVTITELVATPPDAIKHARS